MEADAEVPPALPPKPRLSRPHITIPSITIPYPYAQRSPGAPMTAGGAPLTAGCAVPIGNVNGPFGLLHMYPSKASEFMFRRYEGVKDFTRNTAKSGLSFGEKWLFWFYGRVRGLSRKWFTHIFLFLVVFAYSILGAMLFVSVEGTHEDKERADIAREFSKLSADVRMMADEGRLLADQSAWDARFQEVFQPYEEQLLASFSHGVTPGDLKRWSFWNSVFYCGTIYTTIGEFLFILF